MHYTVQKPSDEERKIAYDSFQALKDSVKHLNNDTPEIEIEETGEKIKIPLSALHLLVEVLDTMKQGKPFSLVPIAAEMTTQAAAECLNCSRPHVVKLLEEGKIPFTKVGRHRRIKMEDLSEFKKSLKATSKAAIVGMMQDAEEMGLYD